MKTRTSTEFLATLLILAVVLGLASLPAQGAVLTPTGGGAWSEPWSGLGSLWEEMLSLLGFQGRPGTSAATRGARLGSAKTTTASGTTPGAPLSGSGVSNSTINPDGLLILTP